MAMQRIEQMERQLQAQALGGPPSGEGDRDDEGENADDDAAGEGLGDDPIVTPDGKPVSCQILFLESRFSHIRMFLTPSFLFSLFPT